MGQTLSEKVWEQHVVHHAAGEPDLLYIDLHLVHEVTSPQAFDGLRLCGPDGAPSRAHRRDDGPQRADVGSRPADRGSDLGQADGRARGQLRRVRHPLLRHGRPGPGHRARDRPGAGAHAAGHDDRVRRQPHLHPRRVRRARVRHRHERGRARAGHADATAACGRARWRSPSKAPARGRDRQGRRARDHRPHRHRRRDRFGDRVPRRGDPQPLDGRAHDRLQHVDRGRRARRADRTRRHDVRVPRRQAARAEGRTTGNTRSTRWRALVTDSDATFDKEVVLDATTLRPHVSWGTNPSQTISIDATVPDPDTFADAGEREAAKRAPCLHGPEGRDADARRCRRHRVHRVVHELAHRRPASRRRRRTRPQGEARHPHARRAGFGRSESASRGRRPRPGVPRRRLRLARTGLLDVPRHEPRQARARRAMRVDERTATSKAARARAVAPTSSPPPSPPQPLSPATSPPRTTWSD